MIKLVSVGEHGGLRPKRCDESGMMELPVWVYFQIPSFAITIDAAPSAKSDWAIMWSVSRMFQSIWLDATSQATISTAWQLPARIRSLASRKQVAPQKQPLKFSSAFWMSSCMPNALITPQAMPGSVQPLVQVVKRWVMDLTSCPQFLTAFVAASMHSFTHVSWYTVMRFHSGGDHESA